MARFDKAIPPGGEGKITLRIKTEGYFGTILKSARVETNDPHNTSTKLSIRAVINAPIYLSSRKIHLSGSEYKVITRTVRVKAQLDKPLKLTPSQFNLAEKLSYTVEEIEEGRRFLIRFKTIPGPHQTYKGFLKLKTNYIEKPEITIRINGRIKKTKEPDKPPVP